MKAKSKKQGLIWAIIICTIGILTPLISAKVFGEAEIGTAKSLKLFIIPVATVLAMYFILYRGRINFISQSTFSDIFKKGWYIILAAILFFLLSFIRVKKESYPSLNTVFFYAITCLLTGVFEEFLCRGLSQGIIMEGYTSENASKFRAIVIAAFIFGILHFSNLLQNSSFVIGTITQVGYATALGIILGVIYYKSKSLVTVILLHGFFNFFASFGEIFKNQAPQVGDASILSLLIQWAIIFPGVFFAYKIYKK